MPGNMRSKSCLHHYQLNLKPILRNNMDIKTETFYATSQAAWRKWLQENHQSKQSVWLVCYKKKTNIPTVTWSTAVDEAICFGWIDSKRLPIDDEKFMQFFSKRKPNSTWSKINKAKIEKLVAKGLVTTAGLKVIEEAKRNGSWTILDQVEKLKLPMDLAKAFKTNKPSFEFYSSLSKSNKKAILQWIILAKQAGTRQKRIAEVVALAQQKLIPKHIGYKLKTPSVAFKLENT